MSILYLHFHGLTGEHLHGRLLNLVREYTPLVQALPPDAALADVSGALRYFGTDATALAERIRARTAGLYGLETTIGVAANPLLARMVAADGPPSAVRTLPDDLDTVTAFLTGKHPALLHGVGPATARTLASYGLDSIDKIAAAPLGTLQRILGTTTGHRLHNAARGTDPTPVTTTAPPRSLTVEHPFPHDELDYDRQRAALVGLSDHLGLHLRTEAHTTRTLTLTARYADRTTTTRTLTLPEPTAHTSTLITAAHTLHDRLALQRARLRTLLLRADGLVPAEHTPRQLLLDPADEQAHRVETAADAVRRRYGPDSARRAGGTAASVTPASASPWTGPSATPRIPGSGSR